MGDMAEVFRDMREHSKEKRASNREASAQLLREAGIPFVERNMGAHLVVDGRIDFWPGTGKWIPRGTNKARRGITSLIRFVKASATGAARSDSKVCRSAAADGEGHVEYRQVTVMDASPGKPEQREGGAPRSTRGAEAHGDGQ